MQLYAKKPIFIPLIAGPSTSPSLSVKWHILVEGSVMIWRPTCTTIRDKMCIENHFWKLDIFEPRSVLPLMIERPLSSIVPPPNLPTPPPPPAIRNWINVETGFGDAVTWSKHWQYTGREKVCFRTVSQLKST